MAEAEELERKVDGLVKEFVVKKVEVGGENSCVVCGGGVWWRWCLVAVVFGGGGVWWGCGW